MAVTVSMGKYLIEVSHPDKMLFPDDHLTKTDVVEYYRQIADVMLPHLKDRPLVMHRFPDGIGGKSFYHKDAPEYFPEWVTTRQVKKEGGEVNHVICDNAATVVYLADQACITPHVWLSTVGHLDHPDRMIFDLDPSDEDFEKVRTAAWRLRDLLEGLDLPSFVMTTGSRGVHVTIPIDGRAGFDEVREFARNIAKRLAEQHEDLITTESRKEKRGNRVFLDTARNAYAQTSVAPYALRPRPGAPVATPLDWEELSGTDMSPTLYTLKSIFQRLGQKADPWKGIGRHARGIGNAQERMTRIMT